VQQNPVRLLDCMNLRVVQSGPSHADEVHAHQPIAAFLNGEGREVFRRGSGGAEQGQPAHAAFLMHTAITRKQGSVLNDHVAANHATVDEDAMIADHAIVAHVRADHEIVAIANPGRHVGLRAAMHSGILTEDVVCADFDSPSHLGQEQVLGALTDHHIQPEIILWPRRQRPDEMRLGPHDAARP